MPKIEISEDQNTVTVDGVEYIFISYYSDKTGVCGVNDNRCPFRSGELDCNGELPCVPFSRKDKKMGFFKLKGTNNHGTN